jgi:hypothetical protein
VNVDIIMFIFFISRSFGRASRELDKKMGNWSKRFWRTLYWITEVESTASTEDKILQCYREVEEERQREELFLKELEMMEKSPESE